MSPASLVLLALLGCFVPLRSAQILPPGSCPVRDPLDHTVLLPHPSDCSRYFKCNHGVPIEFSCVPGLHFNNEYKVCDWPQNANCVPGCFALQNDGGTWTPASCTAGPNNQRASCSLRCNQNNQLRGSSSVQCTESGWNSVNGNNIPKCLPEVCIGEILDNDLKYYLSGEAGILFILDESGSVSRPDFERTKVFVQDVIHRYPLSAVRSAGVITFDSTAVVRIRLNVHSTSDFLQAVDRIPYRGGGTSILHALQAAITEINNFSRHNLTVVVLITDGMSQTDGTPAADIIKNAGHPLFAIGIHGPINLVHLESLSSMGQNGMKHFYHITSYVVLENIGRYLNPPAGSGGPGFSNSSTCN